MPEEHLCEFDAIGWKRWASSSKFIDLSEDLVLPVLDAVCPAA